MSKRVFLSFAGEDKQQVQGLRLLAANPNYDLEFYDESVQQPFNSKNTEYIKTKIKEKISRASITVCLIGTNTHKSEWVKWELEESLEHGNVLIAMALKGIDEAVLPKPIKDNDIVFRAWNPEKLQELIEKA